jgi:predicted DNA binding CopG/RHH family protein
MKRTNFYYPEQMLKRVKKVAEKQGISVSEYIRRAVEEALRKDKI